MKTEKFVVFILTHGRAGKVRTLNTLKKEGYTGDLFLVVDDEDKQLKKYVEIYGKNKVIVFSKKEYIKSVDLFDNRYDDRRTVVFARNACYDIAKRMGYKYFLQLDDDYNRFERRSVKQNKLMTKEVHDLDNLFKSMVVFLCESKADIVALMQGGDLIGGKKSKMFNDRVSRKAMNVLFCRTDKPVNFCGRINEDVNTYCLYGGIGKLFLSVVDINIIQEQTQKQSGGWTDVYLEGGTYVKSLYSVICRPDCVKVGMMGDKRKRVHHTVRWNNCVPKIVSEKI